MTYLYGFTKYCGSDKVWKVNHKFNTGDLLKLGDEYFLVLGKEISFSEQYKYEIMEDASSFEIIEKNFLNKKTIELLHWMVYWRYAPYYNVVSKLFLSNEVEKLLDKKQAPKKNKISHKVQINAQTNILQDLQFSPDGQTLVIFPDLRTLTNLVNDEFISQAGVDVLLSSDSQGKKNKSWWDIKNGTTNIILSTHSEVFQNYKKLKKIIIIRPHKRYYANQQDPRYKTFTVVQKLSEIRNAELESI
ncbi:MAG TPA: hypothetical protein PLP73_01405 [Candidatus Absconditabacterales bacterium]|nr:hypothetical protein [Candidatus Absconditabacterales bacterium]HRU50210.1 hypothetical protein [Candidatus Absconditabacterales bacterium]